MNGIGTSVGAEQMACHATDCAFAVIRGPLSQTPILDATSGADASRPTQRDCL